MNGAKASQHVARNFTGDSPGQAQQRKQRKDGWTEERRTIFLETLATTCNVTAAAKAAGKTAKTARDLRRRDSGFAAAWEDAIAMAYDQLELVMLERATHGTEKPIVRGDKEVGTMRHYSDAVGIRLLQAHRETALRAKARQAAGDPDAVFDLLKKRLTEMHRRLHEEAQSETPDG